MALAVRLGEGLSEAEGLTVAEALSEDEALAVAEALELGEPRGELVEPREPVTLTDREHVGVGAVDGVAASVPEGGSVREGVPEAHRVGEGARLELTDTVAAWEGEAAGELPKLTLTLWLALWLEATVAEREEEEELPHPTQ